VTVSYLARLADRSAAVGTVLCLGVDPDPDGLPDGFSRDVAGRGVRPAAVEAPRRSRPPSSRTRRSSRPWPAGGGIRAGPPPCRADPALIDARGDIGSTSARHAAALYDALGADAVTVSPYMGEDSVRPFIERLDKLAYVLCRTSNPGAGELQDLPLQATADAPAEPLYARVARRVASWGPGGTVGLVVGATAPGELRASAS
jgi:orotidine-5'-phosphate decarboxylase